MLRPLQIFEHKDGNVVIGENGKPVLVRGKAHGQPIKLADLPESFHKYWKEREDDLLIERFRRQTERDAVLRAAKAAVGK